MVKAVLAVDGGGTKTQAAVLAMDGRLLGHCTGGRSNAQTAGAATATENIRVVVRSAIEAAEHVEGGPVEIVHSALYMSGLDLPIEVEALRDALADEPWTNENTVYGNDMHALLRAGTSSPDAVAVVCGTGTNAIAVRADGEVVTFLALGAITGDWGGGPHLGEQGVWYAARAVDGRGEPTRLVQMLPEALGEPDLLSLIESLHLERRSYLDLGKLARVVVEAAEQGDAAALQIVHRQAEEIAAQVKAAATRLGLQDAAIPVVLGGGVVAAREPVLMEAVQREVATVAPNAHIEFVSERPILGAGLLALEHEGVGPEALTRAQEALSQLR